MRSVWEGGLINDDLEVLAVCKVILVSWAEGSFRFLV